MRGGIFIVSHDVPVLLPEFGIKHRHHTIHSDSVAVIVGAVMRERTERECIFIQILGVPQECFDEIGASNVMYQVAEKMAAMRIISEILNDCPTVGVPVSLPELIVR